MKSIRFCLVFMLLIPLSAFPQNFGLKAGYSLSDMLIKEGEQNLGDKLGRRSGFHIGPSIEFPVNENFCIETVFLFTSKGVSISEQESIENITLGTKANWNIFCLDIPVYAKAYIDVENIKLYGMLGPYLGIGLTGKRKTESFGASDLYAEEDDISWGSGREDDFKRLDAGIALGGGILLKSYFFEISAHMGLTNSSPHTEYDMVAKNRLFMITLGYKF